MHAAEGCRRKQPGEGLLVLKPETVPGQQRKPVSRRAVMIRHDGELHVQPRIRGERRPAACGAKRTRSTPCRSCPHRMADAARRPATRGKPAFRRGLPAGRWYVGRVHTDAASPGIVAQHASLKCSLPAPRSSKSPVRGSCRDRPDLRSTSRAHTRKTQSIQQKRMTRSKKAVWKIAWPGKWCSTVQRRSMG
jgi:hypothetical protein